MKQFDYSPLSSKVSLSERMAVVSKSFAIGAVIVSLLALVIIIIAVAGSGLKGLLVMSGFMAVFLLVIGAVQYVRTGQVVRLQKFASANGMTYRHDVPYDGRAGLIFGHGHSKKFVGLLSSDQHTFSEIGNYQYTTGSGKNQTTHDYGFARIKLPRRLPNMVLDAKKNNFLGGRFSNLPTGINKNQRLSLEGDFDKYFTLYAPVKYKRDALYIFTPDVMQALVDAAHSYDCEVIDDSFYIYSSAKLSIHDQKQFAEILAVVRQLQPEIIDQSDYYADERIGDRSINLVAEPGARLKTGMSGLTIAILVIIVLYYGYMFLGHLIFN